MEHAAAPSTQCSVCILYYEDCFYTAGWTLLSSPRTNEVHPDPVPSVHLLLDVPAEGDVLRLANGVLGGADSQRGAAVRRHQVSVAGGARQACQVLGNAILEVHIGELLRVEAVSDRVLGTPAALGDA